MGWTSCEAWTRKAAVEAEALRLCGGPKVGAKHKGHAGLWVLAPDLKGQVRIFFFLLKKSDGCWAYKDMDESMGPFYYDVPLDWLEKALEVSPEWREKVRELHRYRNQIVPEGVQVYAFDPGCARAEGTFTWYGAGQLSNSDQMYKLGRGWYVRPVVEVDAEDTARREATMKEYHENTTF